MSVTRRLFVSAIAGAVVAPAISKPHAAPAEEEWITVAHKGSNQNGHLYPEKELHSMCSQLAGSRVGRLFGGDAVLYGDPNVPLDALAGIVTASRFVNNDLGLVQVKVGWFTGKRPVGSFLTPTGYAAGTAIVPGTDKPETALEIHGYKLHFLDVSTNSAFQHATPVTEAARVG